MTNEIVKLNVPNAPSSGGMQEMVGIHKDDFRLWLLGIDTSRMKNREAAKKIVIYKREVKQVLKNYYEKGVAVRQAPAIEQVFIYVEAYLIERGCDKTFAKKLRSQFGKKVAVLYRERYNGENPPKHQGEVNSKTSTIYYYTPKDKDLLDKMLDEYIQPKLDVLNSQTKGSPLKRGGFPYSPFMGHFSFTGSLGISSL